MTIAVNVFRGWANVLKETELSITLDNSWHIYSATH